MKTPISIPDAVFQAAEAMAQRLGLSRDELYTQAIQAFIATHANPSVTDSLNQIYKQQPSTLEHTIAQLQMASLPREDW